MTASSDASTTAANIGFRAASSIGRMPARAAVLTAAKISPLPWRATEPGPGQAEADPAGEALQLGRGARRVGGDDADAAARVPAVRGRLRRWAERAADGDAVHREPVGRAEVGEEEDTDRERALDDARGRADAALPLAADHAGAGADRPLGHRPGRRAEHRRPDVLGRDLGAPGVVEPGVVALADHGDGHQVPADRRLELGQQLDDRVPRPPHLHRGGEQDRRLEHAPLAHLDRRGELARAVEHGHAGRPSVADDLADRSGRRWR